MRLDPVHNRQIHGRSENNGLGDYTTGTLWDLDPEGIRTRMRKVSRIDRLYAFRAGNSEPFVFL